MAPPLQFFKYEGIGNDFILIRAGDESAVPPAFASRLCDRRLGIGADGVLLLLPSRATDCAIRMRVINADGSIAEMCGNGVRCVALHVARSGAARDTTVRVDTDAGARACIVDDAHGEGRVAVDMGRVRVLGERTVDAGGRRVSVTAADAGNPHAVLIGAFARGDIDHLGPSIATHPDFPHGTNVEFACVTQAGIDLVVWERGVGVTLACGTGACAAAAVACTKGLIARDVPVVVRLPGGALEVTIAADGRATMQGAARHVFSGAIPAHS